MSEDPRNDPTDEEFEAAWESLPAAPPLVPRPKAAQITLRVSPTLRARVKRVASTQSVPYHPLVRSWLIDGVRDASAPKPIASDEAQNDQLNIKLDNDLLDQIKGRADELRRPYHRLAREWVEAGLGDAEQRLGLIAPTDRPTQQAGASVRPRRAASPYATGGGGVTLERRVAARYMALLLTGETAPELGNDRRVLSVAFQQAPRAAVDDLVIRAGRPDDADASLELALGVRRRPNLVPSDDDAKKLIVEFVRALLRMPDDECEHRFGLVVAGPQPHAEQLAELAALASTQIDAPSFFELVREPERFRQDLGNRLRALERLVAHGLNELDTGEGGTSSLVELRTWRLLARLSILMPRVEEPDLADWAVAQNGLVAVARGADLVGAGHLLGRLETLAGQFGPAAATVDLKILRREVHSLLELGKWRHQQAWRILEHLHTQARAMVRDVVGGDGGGGLHLDRTTDAGGVIGAARTSAALVVHGDSGVGKSGLVLGATSSAADASPDGVQVLCVNLRHLPESSLELVTRLGCSLAAALGELSAPERLLVVDAADAATEAHGDIFVHLVAAARESGVRIVAVTASEARQVVRDLVANELGSDAVADYEIGGLDDEQLTSLVSTFPALAQLVANARSRELLRRLVVVDLLLRSDVSGLPLSDVDAMREIWAGLIRRHGHRDRGLPDAREQVLLRLAWRELHGTSPIDLLATLDPSGIDGLRQDGILRAPTDNPWRVLPEFAHDEVRRYAVARVLLANGDPAGELLAAGAPRWALSAGRLACQALLSPSAGADAQLRGRFGALQTSFETLVDAGHGARWADMPGEALLTLGDPGPVLADAWPGLHEGAELGLQRLLRLVDQRHRDANGMIDPGLAEPIVALLLNDETPWSADDKVAKLLREWLGALAVQGVDAGHPLRVRMRERLVTSCVVAESRLAEQQRADAAHASVPTEEEQKLRDTRQSMFREIGFGGRQRRRRPQIPRELTDETVVELLALLGPDLGEDGERLLRRIAQDAPWELSPAIEELFTGRALSGYGRGLLAALTEAYYLDDDADGSGFHEEGIRRHHWRGPVAPLNAWYRGPFFALFGSDFRLGVATLNRLLNHAALVRARTVAGLGDPWSRPSAEEVERFKTELSITGSPHTYVGDTHVWLWYRGSGVGPYPCMSGLQALERVCDQLISAGVPVDRIVAMLLEGCENLAMVGLVVGLLVRHLEGDSSLLDPFLAEPVIWELEFSRPVHESGGFAANSEGLVAPERRTWTMREAASWLVLHADRERAGQLRVIADRLVAAGDQVDAIAEGAADDDRRDLQPIPGDIGPPISYGMRVRNWASALDSERYHAYTEGGVTYVQSAPPEEVQAALEPGNEDLRRGQEAIRLVWRYFIVGRTGREESPPTREELAADLNVAKGLLETPPVSPTNVWDAVAAVAAAALEARMLRGMTLPTDVMEFAVAVVMAVADGTEPPERFGFEGSYFEQGADRSAARALPVLLLPQAASLREKADDGDDVAAGGRVVQAGHRFARAVANETRLNLARGLDVVWTTPCRDGHPCHHELGLELVVASMRDCLLGDWDESGQHRGIQQLGDPVLASLAGAAGGDIYPSRLDPAIRALGAAATHDTCVQDRARELLGAALDAQRRSLLAHDHQVDERGSNALVAARSLLKLAAAGESQPLHEHIDAYADEGTLLCRLLRALAAAAEETPAAAQTARQLWPDVIEQVLTLHRAGHRPFSDRYFGEEALAALIPTPTYENAFLYREVEDNPISWTDALAWRSAIEQWLPLGAGRSRCVDALLGLLQAMPASEQATVGLGWVAPVVLANVEAAARGSYLLTRWLTEIRGAAAEGGKLNIWQQLVDALVVAGSSDLAPYSE